MPKTFGTIFLLVNKTKVMADDKTKQGGRDRSTVSGSEDYEVQYVADKYNVSLDEVRDAISKVGNSREAIDNYFKGNPTD